MPAPLTTMLSWASCFSADRTVPSFSTEATVVVELSVRARVWPKKDKHREPATSCFETGKADCAQNVAVTSPGWAVPWFRQVIFPSLAAPEAPA